MYKLALLSVVMLSMAASTGCGCLGLTRQHTQTVAMPAVQCAPMCAPTCCPDPCACGGGGGMMMGQPTFAP
ncbi:hypothetical protein [Aeoliella sp. SH292]|uniref:hypothetical protein n=1 Tax=Aeoliella sp. SH292 TaxID=3454464 RepID=UPI003F9BB203